MVKIKEEKIENPLVSLTAKADRFTLLILWAHLPIVSFLVPYYYGTWREASLASVVICLLGTISYIFAKGTLAHRTLNGLLLLSYSIVMIAVQFGRIEMHFHVFASLPLLLLYRDWRIIPPAALLVAIQHALFNYCQVNDISVFGFPLIVFNYGSGWDIVLLHAVFVIFEAGVLIYYSKLLREQYIEVYRTNKNLEGLINRRTMSLVKEKEKIESYKKALDKVAITSIVATDGQILDVNKKFEKFYRCEKNDLVGVRYSFFNEQGHNDSFFKRAWNKVMSDQVWRGEVKSLDQKGNSLWSDTAMAPIHDENNEIKGVMSIQFDITDRKEKEETIISQREQIVSQSKLSALGEMAGGIAHEINNPLAIISTTVQSMRKMIKKGMVESELFDESLDDIDETIDRITKIVQGLRNVSRDTAEEEMDECTIENILDDVLSLSLEKFKSHGVGFELKIKDSLKQKVIKVLRVQLSQVFINLLSNAFDEVSKLDEKWLKLIVQETNQGTEFRFIDSGKGVPDEVQEKIFRPFFTTKEIGKGTGLGLSLSYSIVKKHKGSLRIDNSCENTCFVVTIP